MGTAGEVSRLLERLRQNPRKRVARSIQRRLQSLLWREQQKVYKEAKKREREAKELKRKQDAFERDRQRDEKRRARAELAKRKRELREAARALREKRKKEPEALPDVPLPYIEEYREGSLDNPQPAPPDAPLDAPAPPTKILDDLAPRYEIPLAEFCDMADSLGVRLTGDLQLACAKAREQIVRRSPWRAVGWDAPGTWPPKAPGMDRWLAKRSAHTLTALPKILSDFANVDEETELWALSHGLVALRILRELGIGHTFGRLTPWVEAFDIRSHRTGGYGAAPCAGSQCTAPDCGLPLIECGDHVNFPLGAYLETSGPPLVSSIAKRWATHTGTPRQQLIRELGVTFSEEAFALANEGETPWRDAWPPELGVLWALAHFNRWPPAGTPMPQLAAFLQAATPAAVEAEPGWPSLAALEAAGRAAGFALVPGRVDH